MSNTLVDHSLTPHYARLMIFDKIKDFSELLPERGRLLGLDLGTKTIGLALTDANRKIATPMHTIQRLRFSKVANDLKVIIDEQSVVGIVLGFPINMNGSEGPRCQATRDFARNILEQLTLPILLWDERLSTVVATNALLDADLSRQKRAKHVDKIAASVILQTALDTSKSAGSQ